MKHPGSYYPRWCSFFVMSIARIFPLREKCGFDAYTIIEWVKMLQLCPLPISSIVQALLTSLEGYIGVTHDYFDNMSTTFAQGEAIAHP